MNWKTKVNTETLAINKRAIVSAIFTQWSFSSAIHLNFIFTVTKKKFD